MAASTRDALRLIEASQPDRALLDVNLGSETSISVARRLAELGIPYAFATGYGESFRIPADLEAVAGREEAVRRRRVATRVHIVTIVTQRFGAQGSVFRRASSHSGWGILAFRRTSMPSKRVSWSAEYGFCQ